MSTGANWGLRALTALLASAAAVAIGVPVQGHAAPPPSDVAAVSQYFETFPTSSGARLTGGGGGEGSPLPQALSARVTAEAGPDAPKLLELATSAAHGAPPQAPAAGGASGDTPADPASPAPTPALDREAGGPSFGEAVRDGAATQGGGTGLLALVLALTAVGLVLAAALGRRRATPRD
jgi:hypothetical protein